MKIIINTFVLFVIAFNLYAQDRLVSINEKQPTKFILISMPSVDDDVIKKVASTFKHSNRGEIEVGIGTIISYLATPPKETVRKLKHFLSIAEQCNLPFVIEMDGINWWQARPDLWNWWDKNKPS